MKNLVYKILILVFISVSVFFNASISHAHIILPPEAMEFLEQNPNATEEEFNQFMIATYGDGIMEELYGFPLKNTSPKINSSKENENIQKVENTAKTIISARNPEKPFFQNAKDFIILGIKHILGGLDHILFVISLVLVLLPWRKIISMVTTFTIAHSLTLILAGTSILAVSSKIVEPIIAFSIAYMAITTVFFKKIAFFQKMHSRIGVIFIFGLFHGLGFAGIFSDLHIPTNNYLSSILFFNVGVEIGQILILLSIVPLLILLKRNKKIYDISIKVFASVISLLAIFWVIQRIFF